MNSAWLGQPSLASNSTNATSSFARASRIGAVTKQMIGTAARARRRHVFVPFLGRLIRARKQGQCHKLGSDIASIGTTPVGLRRATRTRLAQWHTDELD